MQLTSSCLQASFCRSFRAPIRQWHDFVDLGYAVVADVLKLGCHDLDSNWDIVSHTMATVCLLLHGDEVALRVHASIYKSSVDSMGRSALAMQYLHLCLLQRLKLSR